MSKSNHERWCAITAPSFGPFGKHIEQYETHLYDTGYTQGAIKPKVIIARHLNKWCHQKKLCVKEVDEKTVKTFLKCYHGCHLVKPRHSSMLLDFLSWLRQKNFSPQPARVKRKGKFDYILRDYAKYNQQERGLSPVTIKNYSDIIQHFLSNRFRRSGMRLKEITLIDIRRFIFGQTKNYSMRHVQQATTALRSFFKYLRFRGKIKIDLAGSVPTIANRHQKELPQYLSTEEVERLVQSCDRTGPVGIRNYALLILLARLGLRAGEIDKLTLEDIDWDAGTMTIHGKSGYQDTLPVPNDVGKAIATYLKNSRPKCATRRLFVLIKAPFNALALSSLSSIVRRACQHIGVSPPHQGTHLLRHSLATRMLREGAAMTEIAEILRHRSLATTEIYAKVDIKSLSRLAKPWPGETS